MPGNSLTILSAGTLLKGDVYSEDTLVIEGGVEGNVSGSRVIVKPKGWVHGDIVCRSLSIEPGGVVDGAVRVAHAKALTAEGAPDETLSLDQATLLEVTGQLAAEEAEASKP